MGQAGFIILELVAEAGIRCVEEDFVVGFRAENCDVHAIS
jgi:hypothetical protein